MKFYLFVYFSYIKLECEMAVVVSLDRSIYTISAGSSISLNCVGANLNSDDLVWQFYPIDNSSAVTVIYLGNQVKKNQIEKYNVTTIQTSDYAIQSILTINEVSVLDAGFSYQCVS